MPLKLNVGLSKKIGLPDYGSLGASTNFELELDAGIIGDPDRLRQQVRAIRAITGRQRLDLGQLLGSRFNLQRPEDLSLADASLLIDELKNPNPVNGGSR